MMHTMILGNVQPSKCVDIHPHLLILGPTFKGVQVLNGLHFLYVVRGDKLQ